MERPSTSVYQQAQDALTRACQGAARLKALQSSMLLDQTGRIVSAIRGDKVEDCERIIWSALEELGTLLPQLQSAARRPEEGEQV